MKKIAVFSLFLFAGVLFSCEKNDMATEDSPSGIQQKKGDDLKVVNGRLVFKDDKVFARIYADLAKKSPEDLNKWAEQYDFVSLRTAIEKKQENDTYLNTMAASEFLPYSLLKIANANGEVQVGDKIYWFNGNKSYVVSNETELKNTKADPSGNKNVYESKMTRLDSKKLKNLSVVLPSNGGLDARYQYTFPYNSSFEFKYVHEVITIHVYVGGQWHSQAILHIKFEYKNPSNCCWNQAGDTRDVSYNIAGSVYFINTQYFNLSNTFSTNVSPYPISLAYWASPSNTPGNMTINVSGSIYQKAYVNGVAQVPYTSSGTPLW
jgi:hypothetical protein